MGTFISRVACYRYRKNDILHVTGIPYVGCSVLRLNCTTNPSSESSLEQLAGLSG